jgi:hypothetical protein
MRLSIVFALSATVVVAGACEKRTAPPGGAADSAAVAGDSVAADSLGRDSTAMPMAPAKSPNDSIIGHDSAFGPMGMVDSTGKVVPLRPKRP